jgi:hypothetical protein
MRCGSIGSYSRALMVACVGLASLTPSSSFGQMVAPTKCHLSFSSPLFIPISGTLRELVIDPQCQHVYITNATTNRVEVISLVSGRLGAPIDVGSNPSGIDVTPDGSALYIATIGANAISVVNTALGLESRTIPVPPEQYTDDTPFSIAIANNGLALLSTADGEAGSILQLNLKTGVVTLRAYNAEATMRASSDRSGIALLQGLYSSVTPVNVYLSSANQFTSQMNISASPFRVAMNGGVILAGNNELSLNGSTLQQIGVLPTVINWQYLDVAVDPTGHIGYRSGYNIYSSGANSIDALDLQHLLVTGNLFLGDTLGSSGFPVAPGTGHIAITGDGSLVAVITDHGVSLVQPNPVSFVHFSEFDSSLFLTTDSLTGRIRAQVLGHFVPGPSASIDLAHQDFTLSVGAYAMTIPAGSFSSKDGRYVYQGRTLSAMVGTDRGGGYLYTVVATDITLNDWALPIPISLEVGTNEGSASLSATQADFSPPSTTQ